GGQSVFTVIGDANRVFLAGPALGILSAAVLAVLGFDGRAGVASLVVFTALGAIAAALTGVVTAIIDESRRVTVSRRRVVQVGIHLAVTVWCVLALMALNS
ncbi:MAG: hypothetical protein WD011_04730, partial [Nitriliruptoraceae bacterium]